MKKSWGRILLTFVLGMSMVCAFCACGGQDDPAVEVAIDKEALAQKLATELPFRDALEAVDPDVAALLYDVEEDVQVVLYSGSGATAEEVAVFEAPDAESAKAVEAAAKAHVEEQKEAFADYVPEEVPVLAQAIVQRHGKYVVLCVTDDADAADALIDAAFAE